MRENFFIKEIKKKHVVKLYVDTMNNVEVKKNIIFASKITKVTKQNLLDYIKNLKKKTIFLGIFNNKKIHIANVKVDYSNLNFVTIGFLVFNGYRGKKIIQKNFKKILNYHKFKKLYIDTLYLGVNPNNKKAVKLYQNLGFKKCSLKKNFYYFNINKFDYEKNDVIECFKKLKLKKGDTVYVNPELFRFGSIKDIQSRNNYYKFFTHLILDKIGKGGTIAINSYTFQTLRYGKPFIHEKTVSSSGGLSEYIRKMKGALRSEHPVFSVCSIGKNKKFLCKKNSQNNYGSGSPYDRFLKLNGKILNLGMDFHINPFLHHLEFVCAAPYMYNKLTRVKYYKNSKKINKDYVSAVGYLDLERKHNLSILAKDLKKNNFIQSERLGNGYVHLYSAKKYCLILKKILEKNILALVRNVKFKKGFYPYK